MRDYECMMLFHPGTSAADAEAIHQRFQNTVTTHGGEVVKTEDMGVRDLAYPIEKQTNGHYWLFSFTGDNTLVAEADRDLRLDDRVLRHLIVRDEKWAEKNRASRAKRGLDAQEESSDG